MAERRMFAKTIIDSDAFLDMPLSTQALYFHLSMRADDDGFTNNVKKIQRILGCSDDDLKILYAKKFVIPFDTGVCVIKHWKIHNYIQKDRYKETVYQELKSKLSLKNNGVYTMDTECIQVVSEMETSCTPRLGKDSIELDITPNKKVSKKTEISDDFGISDRVRTWAVKNKVFGLEQHLENFILQAKSKGYKYADWDSAFMTAIRNNWAKVEKPAWAK